MESSFYKAAAEVLELFARLHEQITACGGKPDGDALATIACPDVESRVARAAVDS